MKQRLFAGLIFLLFIAACSAAHKNTGQNNNLDGQWTLAVFMPSQKKTLAEVFGERVAALQFSKATNTVSGTTGCNRFAGTYTADSVHLAFSQNRLLTKTACTGYNEEMFLDALSRVNRYRLIESQLELMQNNDILLIFAKKPE